MTRLLVISSAPALIKDGQILLDKKFVEGMRLYCALWDGAVSCILHKTNLNIPFGRIYRPEELPFKLNLLAANKHIKLEDIKEHDVILCGGDDHEHLHLASMCRREKKKIVFVIENIPETRRQIILLEPLRSFPKKVYSFFLEMRHEIRRRIAFRAADGIQANGYPAYAIYSRMNPNTMIYLDNRVSEKFLASEVDMKIRERRLLEKKPLKLLHSGRLEHIKGSHDLIPIALQLVSRGIDFTLDIFGSGSLEEEIKKGIAKHGLHGKVRLNGAVDFEEELVPFARQNVDIYLSCHRQSDPSCTYVENMGCGLAVIGYANHMWTALCKESRAGWMTPLSDHTAIANAISDADSNRHSLVEACYSARRFAGQHTFEKEFNSRIEHLRTITLAQSSIC